MICMTAMEADMCELAGARMILLGNKVNCRLRTEESGPVKADSSQVSSTQTCKSLRFPTVLRKKSTQREGSGGRAVCDSRLSSWGSMKISPGSHGDDRLGEP